jgi:LPXTG-motif cell wall-anchored protein
MGESHDCTQYPPQLECGGTPAEFVTPAPEAVEVLAQTGGAGPGPLLVALVALLAGLVLVLASRRRRR